MTNGASTKPFRQAETFRGLWNRLAPHVSTDRSLPGRIDQLLRKNRNFGSRDRRIYRELLYTTLRYLPWLERRDGELSADDLRLLVWLCAPIAALRQLKETFVADWPALPSSMALKSAIAVAQGRSGARASILPDWFRHECPLAFESPHYDALSMRSPLWIRIQPGCVQAVADEFKSKGWSWEASSSITNAWRMDNEVDVESTEAYLTGKLEIQDIGSQWVLTQTEVLPGSSWLDACAGAGGKTLQLAALLGPSGRVVAHDVRPAALTELQLRVNRARIQTVSVTPRMTGTYDGVLVDAPCSGSGTWRRAPHLKWSTHERTLHEMAELQTSILLKSSGHVRPGGQLLYATCSLARSENERVIEQFLKLNRDFCFPERGASFPPREVSEPRATLMPASLDSDGFFAVNLVRV